MTIKRDYPDRPIVGVLAVVRRRDEVLIVKRARMPALGRWGYPGGAQELGETVFAAALRELQDETGVIADALMTLPIIDTIRADDAGRIAAHWTLVPVLCAWRYGDGHRSDEVADWRWIRPDDVLRSGLDVLPNVDKLGLMALAR
jgi:ADP-ribose pyrophosphatase YjhB (NUDIX family)